MCKLTKTDNAKKIMDLLKGLNSSELVLIIDNDTKIVANTIKAVKNKNEIEVYTRNYYIKNGVETKSDSIGLILVPLKKINSIEMFFGRSAESYLDKHNCSHMYNYVLNN